MKNLKNKWFYICSFLLYSVIFIIFYLFTSIFIEPYANSVLIKNFSSKKASDNIVIIVDDIRTNDKYGNLSFQEYTKILKYLEYSKPKVIGFDLIMEKLNSITPEHLEFAAQVKKTPNLVLGFFPNHLGSEYDEKYLKLFEKKYSLNTSTILNSSLWYNSPNLDDNLLIEVVKSFGFVNVSSKNRNTDKLYNVIGLLKINNKFYPSLPLKMFLYLHNTNDVILTKNNIIIPKTKTRIPSSFSASTGTAGIKVRYYKIMEQQKQFSHINITASAILEAYEQIKMGNTPDKYPQLWDYMNGDYLNPKYFKDKIVLVGQTSGANPDVYNTPMNDRHAGVDIQASVLDNIENNYFLKYIPSWLNIIFCIIFSFIAFYFIMKYRFIKGLLLIFLADIIYLLTIYSSAKFGGYVFNYAAVFVLQSVSGAFAYSFKFITENKNKEKIKLAMGKYISQDIMKNVVKNIDDLKLGGKRAIVTVLFSDIRGFTSLSEKMPAEEVSMILNDYFTEMEPIITKYNGVINKFIGDAVMAIFGEPIQDINHAKNAVKCAYEMLKRLEYLREKWILEGKPKIEIGVGINTGEVFIGNIGTESRMEYTVIGDTVNLASRIEHYNKVYKTNLLVSSSTYSQIAGIADVIKINEVQIRGKKNKMNIYEVLRIDKNG